MICRRRSPREKPEDRAGAGARAHGLTEPPPASQAPPRVFRARALRGIPGTGDRRRPDGGSPAGGTRRPAATGAGSDPAAQDERQTLHLVSGRGAAAARGRGAGARGAPRSCGPGPAGTSRRSTARGSEGDAAAELTLRLVQATQHVHQERSSLPGFVQHLLLLPRRLRNRGNVFQRIEGKFTLLALLGRFPVASQRGGGEVPRDAVVERCPPSGLAPVPGAGARIPSAAEPI